MTHASCLDVPAARSDVVDRGVDDYWRRVAAGEQVDLDAFCHLFSPYASELRDALEAERMLGARPDLFSSQASADDTPPPRTKAPPWPQVGDSFLDYELQGELGRGAFAHVYLARQPKLGGRLVAVKVTTQEGHEARTLGRLDHPNVVPVYGVDTDPTSGLTAVSMPYVGGATLHDLLGAVSGVKRPPRARIILDVARRGGRATGPIPEPYRCGRYVDGVCHLMAQVADALAHVHAQGLVHRDLKPQNVLLGEDGRPRLLDFNLAAAARQRPDQIGGTVPYVAPEHLPPLARTSDVVVPPDVRADLYALGILLFELLTGRHPYGAADPKAPVDRQARQQLDHLKNEPLPLRRLNPTVGPRLAGLVTRLIARDPAARPATATDVAAALRREVAPRRPWLRLAVLTLALTALFVAVLSWSLRPTPEERLDAARQALDAGHFAAAHQLLDPLVASGPHRRAALLLRGRAFQHEGSFAAAEACYQEADPEGRDATALALLGYCRLARPDYVGAVAALERAAALGGETPELLADLAFGLSHIGREAEAARALDRAEALGGRPAAAVAYNRFYLAYRDATVVSPPRATAAAALDAYDRARALGPPDDFLASLAAQLCHDDLPRACDYLEEVADLGLDLSPYRDCPRLKHLHAEPRFRTMTVAAVSAAAPRLHPRVAEPPVRLLDSQDEK